eukprot:TRINITY_DN9127_c1_g1_i1.p1 TRINITY_DN9127_c1_g1~~TRINITY_DN9127_c1_g1_i1.p1  ORF type:complete len:129 (+),score=2.80 TRINITY_DN9127_c1_g1_i1:374-760(+)
MHSCPYRFSPKQTYMGKSPVGPAYDSAPTNQHHQTPPPPGAHSKITFFHTKNQHPTPSNTTKNNKKFCVHSHSCPYIFSPKQTFMGKSPVGPTYDSAPKNPPSQVLIHHVHHTQFETNPVLPHHWICI